MKSKLGFSLIGAILAWSAILAHAAGGLQFDGVDDYVTIGAAPGLGSETFTLETWFQRTGTGQTASSGTGGVVAIPLVTKGRGEADNSNLDMNYFLGIRGTDGVLVADFEEGATGSSPGLNHPVVGVTPVTSNVWHHAAVSYDGSKWQLFLDGVLEAELVIGQPPRGDSIQHAALGSALTSTGAPAGAFAGILDEVRIWNYARSAAQISNNLNVEIPAEAGLVGRWALDETTGTTAADSSGSALDGTLANGPVWGTGYNFVPVPTVTLISPADQGFEVGPGVTFTCDAADAAGLASATLYVGPAGGPLAPVETKLISGTSATVNFSATLTDAQNYSWNCQVINSLGGQGWAAIDFDLLVDANFPDDPVLVSPLDGAIDVPVPPALQVQVSDPNADPLTVAFYGRDTQPGDFTIAVLPDTHYYVSGLNGGTPQMFIDQTDWIVNNREAENIAFVTHLGDCVQNGDSALAEWNNVTAAMYSLEYPFPQLPDGIPYGIAVGNHDQSPLGDADGTTDYFNQFFGELHFLDRDYYGGHHGSNNDNHFQLFSASGLDFIIVHLEYDTTADAAVLAWADGLLQTHSDRRAIVVTHHLINTGNPATFGPQGQAIYEALKGNPNLILMLGGHVSGEGQRVDTFNGNTVHSLLADYQSRTNGGDGWMRLLEFSPSSNEIRVKTYSPTLLQFETDADSEFTLSNIPLDPQFKLIGEDPGVPSGSTASISWSDAAVGSSYEWMVTVTDPSGRQTPGSIWSFDTAPFDLSPPIISGVEATNITDHAAEIVWTTDEVASSLVEFGIDATYGSQLEDTSLVAAHSIVISNLALGQTYHYRVHSTDREGNAAVGPDMTFTTATDDLTPPTPDPMTWASAPAAAGPSAITMTASTASDSAGVEYYFENVTDPAHDSGWQAGTTFTDNALLPDTAYTYRVKARDLAPASNETGFSSQATATTGAGSATVLRGPYLQNGKPDGVSIMWRTDNFTDGRVWYGDAPTNLNQVADEPVPPPPFIARGTTWKYLDDGSDQGTGWQEAAFDDSPWNQGAAQLGYGDGDEQTTVGYGPNSANKFITTYFRHTFSVSGAAGITALELGLLRDDGAVIYLNGTELRRDNMPGGTISYNTPASSAIGSTAETIFYVTTVDPALLLEGDNVIAVEIHQANATSSDISFDLELYTPQPSGGGDGFDHLVRLSGLDPNTTYYYRVGTAQGEVLAGGDSDHYFATLPTPGTTQPVRIWALGDSGTADANARSVRDAYLGLAAIEHPADFLVMLGDNAYTTGTDAEYQNAVFQNMYEDILRNRVLWSTQGNHDAGAYFDIFDLPVAGEAGGIASGTEDYYSVDYANVHLICLSSQDLALCSDPNSPMYQWLNADLLATTQPWIIAFWHHPAYSKGSHDSDNAADSEGRMTYMRTIALPILEAGGVDLVLSGHCHSYERSKFINGHYGLSGTFNAGTHVVQAGDGDPAGDGAYVKNSEDGAVYITAGSSGKISGVTQHNAMQVWLNSLGSVIIDIDNDKLDVRFLRELDPLQIDDGFQISKNLGPDLDPPAPDPMTWASVPTAVDSTSITMTATAATDTSGVEYLFENLTAPGHDSGWQAGASYVDGGLDPATSYTYRVTARDQSPAQNTTGASSALAATTDADTTPPAPDPMTWASVPTAVDTTSITMTATVASDISGVEYRFRNLTDPAHDSGWQASPTFVDTALLPGTLYVYQVSARDLSPAQNTTGNSIALPATTDPDITAPAPDPMTWASAPTALDSTSITMTATTASDLSGVEYRFQNLTDPAHDSGWQAVPSYLDTGLIPGTEYTYQVTARDLSPNQNPTAPSVTAAATTAPDTAAPAPDPMTFASAPAAISDSSIAMSATAATDPSGVEYLFENLTDPAHNSGWQAGSSFTDSGLDPATSYTYQVTARDLSAAQNATAASAPQVATTAADSTAPAPDPMTWASVPAALDSTSIAMTATTAADLSGVEYLFQNLTDPSHDSGWQASATYVDTGLSPESSYTYTVTARDLSPAQNASAPSASAAATTAPDSAPPSPDPMTWASLPTALDSTSISMTATTATDISGVEYLFQNLTDPAHDSGWQGSATYLDSGLAPGTTYTYQVTARDLSPAQNTAVPSTSAAATTDPDTASPNPDPMTWASVPAAIDTTSITMTATTAIDASGAEYYFENLTDPAHDSGWQASPTYLDSGLAPLTAYSYRVSARDLSPAQNATAPSATAGATTTPDLAAPAPDPMVWASAPTAIDSTSISMSATIATDLSGVEYLFQNLTDPAHDSGWQASPAYVDSGLDPDTSYTYQVSARDLSPAQNATAPSATAAATTDPDLTAPAPDPMTWASAPAAIDSTSVSMTATTASDLSGVEYLFENLTDPTHDSGWQASPTYVDSALTPDTSYTYQVSARDLSPAQNTTGASAPAAATTDPDTASPAPDPMTWASVPAAIDSTSISMAATIATDASGVEYLFENLTDPAHGSGWQASPAYVDTGLAPGTSYSYQVSARDLSPAQNTTAPSAEAAATTEPDLAAPAPDPMTWAVAPAPADSTSITMAATIATDISGVEYRFENLTDPAHDSGWQASPTFLDSGLAPGTSYNYRVSARDLSPAQNTTAPSATAVATTAPDSGSPTPNPMTWASIPNALSTTAITMTATTASDISGVEYQFVNLTDPGHTSAWQASPTYLDAGLAPGSTYVYQVIARDLSPAQNSTGASIALPATTDPDLTAPAPDPMTWASVPAATGPTTIAMTATVASDLSGVAYYFYNLTDPAHDSGWQASPSYTDTGLTPGTSYTYQVTARDLSPAANTTLPSASAAATTANPQPALLFADNFESGDLAAGAWVTQDSSASAQGSAAFTGSFGAELKNSTWMQRTVNTLGYDTIELSYARSTTALDNGEALLVEWSIGGAWTLIESTQATTYEAVSFALPAAADDAAALTIRFTINGNRNNEKGRVDDVLITGLPTAPPAAPGLASAPDPANASTDVSAMPTLTWTAGSDATSHDVYFGSNANPGASEAQGNQAGTSFDAGTLAFSTTYYWRIDEVNATGTTTGSVWSFTTQAPPPAPGLASAPTPADATTNVSTTGTALGWTAGSDTDSHDVYFGTNPSPGAGEFRGNQAGTSFDPGTLTSSTTYFWRIDEVNASGTTEGTLWSFTTAAAPANPVTLFSDGFESGDFAAGGWTSLNGHASVKGGSSFSGSDGAELRFSTWIETAVSTAGHHAVHLTYVRRTQGLDSGELLYAEWWDGAAWSTVESTADGSWAAQDWALPATAAGNANLKIRFRLESNSTKEKGHIDDVEVSGIPD